VNDYKRYQKRKEKMVIKEKNRNKKSEL
jgi:hypothetical protein